MAAQQRSCGGKPDDVGDAHALLGRHHCCVSSMVRLWCCRWRACAARRRQARQGNLARRHNFTSRCFALHSVWHAPRRASAHHQPPVSQWRIMRVVPGVPLAHMPASICYGTRTRTIAKPCSACKLHALNRIDPLLPSAAHARSGSWRGVDAGRSRADALQRRACSAAPVGAPVLCGAGVAAPREVSGWVKVAPPICDRWEDAGIVPRELWKQAGQLGFIGITTPEARSHNAQHQQINHVSHASSAHFYIAPPHQRTAPSLVIGPDGCRRTAALAGTC